MNIAKLTFKLKAQIRSFAEDVCSGLGLGLSRAVSDVLLGVCKSGDVKLTSIGRALNERTKLENVVERLSRNLASKDVSRHLNRRLVEGASSRVDADTLLVIDGTDVQKRYARSMEFMDRVRDGSEGKIGWGYHCMQVAATEVDGSDVIPLWGHLYSVRSERCGGENAEIIFALREVSERFCGRGVWVMDRGFDRGMLFKELLGLKQRFVVRLKGGRRLSWRRGVALAGEIRVPMRFSATVTKVKNGRRRRKKIEFGTMAVRLPGFKEQLWLVKVRFEGAVTPIFLLTNVAIDGTLASVLWVVKAYLSRWRVEEVIRHVKQSYNLEDIRVRGYNALRNMTALVIACANFVAYHLGLRAKLEIMASRLLRASQRVGNIIKNFKYYALAAGLKAVLNYMNHPFQQPRPNPPPSPQIAIRFPTAGGRPV